MHVRKRILGAAAACALLIAFTGWNSTIGPAVHEASIFGKTHLALGSAQLMSTADALTVQFLDDSSPGGVAVEMSERENLNVYLEPVDMPIGAYFETTVLGEIEGERAVIGRILHNQTASRTTEVGVDFTELRGHATDGLVNVATYVDGVKTYETSLPIDETANVGTVTSVRASWAESYHWVCVNQTCSLMIDPAPAETITFAHDPSISQPFNYLVFSVGGVENVVNPSTMEFMGTGLSKLAIVGEDNRNIF